MGAVADTSRNIRGGGRNFKHVCLWCRFKARFPLSYFAAAGEIFRKRKKYLVVLSCRQSKVKQKMKIFNDWTSRTSIFSDA